MKLPVNWIGEFVKLNDPTPDAVLAELVRVGLEEESTTAPSVSGPVVVGQVLEFTPEPQTNGKTINWCTVQVAPTGGRAADGGDAVRGIVCGAHNFAAGDKVVVTLPGSVLPGDFVISARKTYGHLSDGMMASARELGLGDEHDGILRLATLGLDPAVGANALDILGLSESGIEINVTPDRGYCFSVRGVAREYGHATGNVYTDPASLVSVHRGGGFPVTIEDAAPIRGRAGVRRFVTLLVTGVDATRPTPPWMATRLRLSGVRSISLVVDITNYVMMELGHPIHGYDADAIAGGLAVRRAAENERLTTLDGQERILTAEDLVITDDSGPIGLAGVMGGASTEVSLTTKNVLVEAGVFDPVSIARSARRHKLPSEASKRYERGVDPDLSGVAASRVAELLAELAGGVVSEIGSDWRSGLEHTVISLPIDVPSRLIGVTYDRDEVVGILRSIGCTIDNPDDDVLRVVPPSWRPDLTLAPDLVEEVARIVGYDKIPTLLPSAPSGRGFTFEQHSRRIVANALAGSGLTEVSSYPFVSEAKNDEFEDARPVAAVRLANPIDPAFALLRVDVLPTLLDVVKRNVARGLTDLAVFEVGTVFRPESQLMYGSDSLPIGTTRPSDAVLEALYASIPAQPRHLAIVYTGQAVAKQPGQHAVPVDWQQAIWAAREVSHALGVSMQVSQSARAGFHPGRTAEFTVSTADGDRVSVGFGGELHPDIVASYDLHGRVAAIELDLDLLVDLSPRRVIARPIATMPAATQDLSLVVADDVVAGDVLAAVSQGAGPLLEHVELVEDYHGDNVATGHRSLTFALRFRADDRTLTAGEANAAKDAAVALAASRFGASLRA